MALIQATRKLFPQLLQLRHLGRTMRYHPSVSLLPTQCTPMRHHSTVMESMPEAVTAPRTHLTDPKDHTEANLGEFYTIPEEDYNKLMPQFLKKDQQRQQKIFRDRSLMIRPAGLEVISFLESGKIDFNQPVLRFLLYGERGAGVSAQMAHIAHYACKRGWLIVHFSEPHVWLRYTPDLVVSDFNPEVLNTALQSAKWLNEFLHINSDLLKQVNPRLSEKVQWNQKEDAPVGTPWLDVIAFGLSRSKYTSDTVGIVLREIRRQASSLPLRTLVSIDGANFLWSETNLWHPEKPPNRRGDFTPLLADQLALVRFLRRLLAADWSNGLVVCGVGPKAAWPTRRKEATPRYLLTDEGFNHLDPFVPIGVDLYSEREMDAALRYYIENRWITNEAARTMGSRAQREMVAMSDWNAQELDRVVGEW